MSSWSLVSSLAVPLAGSSAVLLWRLRETRRPVTPRAILLPPVAMSTGFSMFVLPDFRPTWQWALGAFLAGAFLLSVPLIRSTELTLRDGVVWVKRSRTFLAILIGLVAIRLALRNSVSQVLPATETAGVFFILAFGMIVRWRTWMWGEYQRITGRSQ